MLERRKENPVLIRMKQFFPWTFLNALDILEVRHSSGQSEGSCEGNHSQTDLWEMHAGCRHPDKATLDFVKLTKATLLRKQTKHILLLLLF